MIVFASNEKQGDSQVEQIKTIMRNEFPGLTGARGNAEQWWPGCH